MELGVKLQGHDDCKKKGTVLNHYFSVEGLKEKWEQDFFHFRPITQEKEVTDESDFVFTNSSEDEDDILYSYRQNGEHYKPSSLLFIHQTFEQVQILKWYNI